MTEAQPPGKEPVYRELPPASGKKTSSKSEKLSEIAASVGITDTNKEAASSVPVKRQILSPSGSPETLGQLVGTSLRSLEDQSLSFLPTSEAPAPSGSDQTSTTLGQELSPLNILSKMSLMDRLLAELEAKLHINISELPECDFQNAVDDQFGCFMKIADLRQSLKEDLLHDPSLSSSIEALTKRYKTFIQQNPGFREAAIIKEKLGTVPEEEREGKKSSTWEVPLELSEVVLPAIGERDQAFRLGKLRATAKRSASLEAKQEWKAKWRSIQRTLFEGAQRVRSLVQHPSFRGKKFTWMSGTSSSTLVPMLRMPVPELGGAALIPTGQLLRYGIVPLSGELAWGISEQGPNVGAVSGVSLSHLDVARNYATTPKKVSLFDFSAELAILKRYNPLATNPDISLNRVKIAVLRLQFAKAQGLPVDEAIDQAKDHVGRCISEVQKNCGLTVPQWETYGCLVGHSAEQGGEQDGEVFPGMVVGVKMLDGSVTYGVVSSIIGGIIRCVIDKDGSSRSVSPYYILRYTDNALNIACQKEKVNQESLTPFERAAFLSQENRLRECLQILQGAGPRQFSKLTPEEEMLIRAPAGLIFGSFTDVSSADSLSARFSQLPYSHLGEVVAKGPQKLGEDIQVIFVEEASLELVKEYVGRNLPTHIKIQIVGMKALAYLAIWSTYKKT